MRRAEEEDQVAGAALQHPGAQAVSMHRDGAPPARPW